jgi:ubiquitin-conjugating enzyme E2 G1
VGLEDDNNMFVWDLIIEGPPDSLYTGGYFKAKMRFPHDYPNMPPEMRFISKMFHPNIYEDGKVCISILHPPGKDAFNEQEREDEKWRPILGVDAVILSVMSMLQSPNIDSPANIEASVMYRDNRANYECIVKRQAQDSLNDL